MNSKTKIYYCNYKSLTHLNHAEVIEGKIEKQRQPKKSTKFKSMVAYFQKSFHNQLYHNQLATSMREKLMAENIYVWLFNLKQSLFVRLIINMNKQ